MSDLNKKSPDLFGEDSSLQFNNENLSEEMPSTFILPYWMQTPWFKTVKIGLCVLCFPLIYFMGKFLSFLFR